MNKRYQAFTPSTIAPRLTKLSVGTLSLIVWLSGCAAELEDADEFQTKIRPGLGASGVVLAKGDKTDNSVAPQQPTDVNPAPSSGVAPQTTATVAPQDSTSSDTSTSDAPSTGVSAECADAPTRILQEKCDGIACHGSPGTPATAFSDIASTTDPMNLLDVPALYTCSSKMLIDSQNPADSAILSAVQSAGHCSGGRMPSGGPYLSDDEIRCLTEWVNAVASGAI